MSSIHKKAIAILLVLICFMNTGRYEREARAENHDKYLVFVQQKNGSWKEYKNLVELSENGYLMIKAKRISKALGFTYQKNNDGTFDIKRSDAIYNTYTKDANDYIYSDGIEEYLKMAPEKPYTSKQSEYNLSQISSLSTLAYYRCFVGEEIKAYPGFDGVICYSKYNPIPETVPIIERKPITRPAPVIDPEMSTVTIEGVDFPVRVSFLERNKSFSDWGGTAKLWNELEREVDGSLIISTNLAVDSDKIEFTHQGLGCDGISLSKASKGYKLSISVKLEGTAVAVQNASILQAMIATISSKPSTVYEAIFTSFTTNETYGINEDTYVTVGDCRLKVKMEDGIVTYYILGSK